MDYKDSEFTGGGKSAGDPGYFAADLRDLPGHRFICYRSNFLLSGIFGLLPLP